MMTRILLTCFTDLLLAGIKTAPGQILLFCGLCVLLATVLLPLCCG